MFKTMNLGHIIYLVIYFNHLYLRNLNIVSIFVFRIFFLVEVAKILSE